MKILIVLVLVVASVLAVYTYTQQPTGQVIALDQPDDFRVFTQAVCEDNSTGKFCMDKIFFSCRGEIHMAEGDMVECDNKSIHVGGVNLGSLQIARE